MIPPGTVEMGPPSPRGPVFVRPHAVDEAAVDEADEVVRLGRVLVRDPQLVGGLVPRVLVGHRVELLECKPLARRLVLHENDAARGAAAERFFALEIGEHDAIINSRIAIIPPFFFICSITPNRRLPLPPRITTIVTF